MELLQLKYFVEVAHRESMTLAARHFGIPQPSMSQTVSRLEKELGCSLFDRKNNRLSLNADGRMFLEYAQNALESLSDGVRAIEDSKGKKGGEIKLLVLQNRNSVIEAIAEFSKLNPLVSFKICHLPSALEGEDFDLCIGCGKESDTKYEKELLVKERFSAAVNSNSPLAERKSLSLSDLSSERLVSLLPEQSLHMETLKLFEDAGTTPNIEIVCDDPYYVRKYVSLGMASSIVPEFSWNGLWDENVKLVPLADINAVRNTYVYYDSERYLSKVAGEFKTFLREFFKKKGACVS